MTHRPPFSPFSLYSSRGGKNLKQPLSVMMRHGMWNQIHPASVLGTPCETSKPGFSDGFLTTHMRVVTTSATPRVNRNRDTEMLETLHFQRKVTKADFESFPTEKQSIGIVNRRSGVNTPMNSMGNDCGYRPCTHYVPKTSENRAKLTKRGQNVADDSGKGTPKADSMNRHIYNITRITITKDDRRSGR